jgi:hypothetical protein
MVSRSAGRIRSGFVLAVHVDISYPFEWLT